MNFREDHTFVICAYQESPFLEECIRSLKGQTSQSTIILYTSTPNEFIRHLCEKYQIMMHSKPGGGIGRDWNNALSFVTTPFATIAHQDDVYLDTYGEKIMLAFKKDPETLIAYSDYSEWKSGVVIPANRNLKIKTLMLKTIAIFPKSKFWRKRVLAFGNAICCPAVSYSMRLLKDFRFDETMKVSLDWKAWYTISQMKGSFQFISEALMYHRIHEESETTNSIQDNSRTKEDLVMYKLYWPQFIASFLMRFYVKSQETND